MRPEVSGPGFRLRNRRWHRRIGRPRFVDLGAMAASVPVRFGSLWLLLGPARMFYQGESVV